MKKLLSVIAALAFGAAFLTACGSSAETSSAEATAEPTTEATAEPEAEATTEPAAETADTASLESIVAAIEAVNPVSNPRKIDDFSLENEMGLTSDNIVSYLGDVTNDQANCALVFVAKVKDGSADDVVSELETYKDSMSSSLYAEFADKVEKAKDAIIEQYGDTVVMVISGVDGPDYSEISSAIKTVLG